MDKSSKIKLFKRIAMISAVLLIIIFMMPSTAVHAIDDHDGIDESTELYYMQLYAPTLYFKAGENFFPVNVSYLVDNSILYNWTGATAKLVDLNPTINSIGNYKSQLYFLGSALGNFSAILADYSSKRATLGYTIYGHVYPEEDFIVVQYWFNYAYNDHSINQHEGDWEMVEVILNGTTEIPISAAYSQHFGGEVATWVDVEKTNSTHPNVYVARGSHANYFRPYQGKVGLENDEVANDGFILPYNDAAVHFELLGELGSGNHSASQNWLEYGGRWGNWTNLADAAIGFAGPYGPGHQDNSEKWFSPASWSAGLASGAC